MTEPAPGSPPAFRRALRAIWALPRHLFSVLRGWYARHRWFRWGTDAAVVLALVVFIAFLHMLPSLIGSGPLGLFGFAQGGG